MSRRPPDPPAGYRRLRDGRALTQRTRVLVYIEGAWRPAEVLATTVSGRINARSVPVHWHVVSEDGVDRPWLGGSLQAHMERVAIADDVEPRTGHRFYFVDDEPEQDHAAVTTRPSSTTRSHTAVSTEPPRERTTGAPLHDVAAALGFPAEDTLQPYVFDPGAYDRQVAEARRLTQGRDPDAGHVWEISARAVGAGRTVGDQHGSFAEYVDDPWSVTVQADSLAGALQVAARVPLQDWLVDGVPQEEHEQP